MLSNLILRFLYPHKMGYLEYFPQIHIAHPFQPLSLYYVLRYTKYDTR